MVKTGFVIVMAVFLISGSVIAGPAQEILSDLADSARSERMISGMVTIGIGAAVGIGGFILLNDVGLGGYAAIAGGLVALPGVITLVIPSSAEIACNLHCQSEIESASALEELAAAARFSRYVSGVINIAAGTVSLLFPINVFTQHDYIFSAIMSYGMAVMDFLFPSKEEMAFERYLVLVGEAG